MARSGARRKPRPKPQARPQLVRARRAPQPRSIEDTMFFPRLIRSAKWVFVFLALVFGVGFVVFGVGSGQGTGLGDILQGNQGSSSSGADVDKAQDRVQDNPRDPIALRDLGNALVNDGRPGEAIPVFQRYLRMRPKDLETKRTLAVLYLTRANDARTQYDLARTEALSRGAGGLFGPPAGTEFGRALGGRIDQEFEAQINRRLTEAATQMQSGYSQAATLYAQIAATRPEDEAQIQLQLGDAAYQARRIPLAIRAYQRFLKLAPDSAEAAYAKQQIKTLKSGAANVQPG
jgi:tetratricopeptide (TPR) repeat protein